MKKIFSIAILLFALVPAYAQVPAAACCPEFTLAFQRDLDCTKQGTCLSANGGEFTASMCKYSTNSFLVVPGLPGGYDYYWIITGGTPSTATGNPVSITWGGGSTGTIIVTITSKDSTCVKTIKESICLRDAPVAAFTFSPNNACAGTLISFINTSVGGAGVYWDFGDGNFAGNVTAPTHAYALPGTYQVTIYVTTDTAACHPSPTGSAGRPCCGCTSSYSAIVTVKSGSPLVIVPKACINQCLCAGDTAEYCVTQTCTTPYNWTVAGGTIISGAGTQCIRVKWTGPYPTSISLSAPNCGNPCGNTAALSVPVLVPNIPIQPATPTVCQNSVQTYSLPAMPGVFYTWTVTGGGIVGPNANTPVITVVWGAGPTGQVTCNYQNPLKPNCSGTSVLPVSIKPLLRITGPTQSCVGCTVNFSAFGSNVSWSGTPLGLTFLPPNGPNTTVSFPASASTITYTITATGPAGVFCNSPVSAFVVVAPKPVLTIAPSTINACPGMPVKFVATSSVNTTNITWILPAGAAMIANTGPQSDTAVVQFTTVPATVTATQSCAFNLTCSQATAIASVTKPPAPILNAPVTNPCIDQLQNYSISNAIPGINYTWTISNNLGTITLGQGTGNITVLWHGNNAVSNQGVLTVSNCGGSATANITVKLPVFPVITKTGSCFPFTLTSSTAGPYLWTGPGVSGPAALLQTITATQPGTYTVTINAGSPGSCAQTTSITIPPSQYFVSILPPCIVSSCNLNSINVPFTVGTNIPSPVCQWYFIPPNSVIPIPAPGGNVCTGFSGTQQGTYFLVITNPATGCKDTSNKIRIPQDINFCCANPPCNSLPANAINFTHSGCSPTVFTGTFTLPPGWSTGSLPVTYCYGDGTSSSGPSLNASHQYAAAGIYTACIVRKLFKPSVTNPGTNDTCCVSNCHQVTIPVVAKFTAAYNCNTGLLTITDGSSYYPSSAGAVYTWGYTGAFAGTFTNGPNQVITPTVSGTFNVTLSVTLNGCTSPYTLPVTVVIPSAAFTINPNPSCDGSLVSFNATTPGMATYNWQFGDNSFSYLQSPKHIYAAPGTYSVTLTVTTPEGCTRTLTQTVTIQPRPKVTLTPNPVTICPGSSVTITASINANGNTMCPGLSSYTFQWYNNGNPAGPPTNSPTFVASAYGNYFAILTGNATACNCKIITDTARVNWYPKPVAKIKGASAVCLISGSGTVTLSNAVFGYPTYNWSSNSPANISFNPNNAFSTVVTISAAGNFQIYLEVIDANGCKAYDTLCIYAANSPSVVISPPAGALCSGHVYSLLGVPTPPTAPPAGYSYLWNNGAITNPVNVSAPGAYTVTVTDKNTGCSGLSNPVFINQGPDLRLFPSCCDTICDNKPINIVPPLPLAPGQTACTQYSIIWLDNNVPLSPQPSPCNILNTASLLPGLHNISIAVTINGCTDTSNVFHLFIKHCGECACTGTWKEITVSDGTKSAALNCSKKPYKWLCRKPFTINATYSCSDATCPGSATYTLTPPSGPPVSGNLPFTYTPTQQGNYTIVLYGMCGTKACDTCIIIFAVDCPPDTVCCKYDIKIATGNVAYSPGTNATIASQTFTVSGLTGVSLTAVRAEVISYDMGSNFDNECLGCKTFPFTWASIHKAGNIGAVAPKITLYGGATTPVFNPTSAPGIYQNPREVIWSNGSTFTIGGPLGISLLLPPAPLIDCCELKGKICVKFTFRDDQCRECIVVVCFNVSIRK